MENLLAANALLVGLNTILLVTLLVLYARMLREVRSRFTLGLVLFAGVLLVHNLAQLYFYVTMQDYFAGGVVELVLVQNALATLAIGFLTYATLLPGGAARRAAPGDVPDSG